MNCNIIHDDNYESLIRFFFFGIQKRPTTSKCKIYNNKIVRQTHEMFTLIVIIDREPVVRTLVYKYKLVFDDFV